MNTEAAKLILDIREAIGHIQKFTAEMTLEDYLADDKTRAAVERKFEVVGEACTRLRERAPDIFEAIPTAPQIIGFRNRLIHGYDHVDDAIVWDVISRKMPELLKSLS
jgi:uncharacterized protein with HEPN domain